MPKLMEKKDWMQTVADVGLAESVWFENVAGNTSDVSFSLPESGRYRVIFVKLDDIPRSRSTSLGSRHRNISPKVRALRGAGRMSDSRDYKDMLADALAERYEALG